MMAESKAWHVMMAMGIFCGLTLSGCGAVVPECEVEYAIQEDWGGGYTAAVTLRNRDDAAWDQWALDFELPSGQTVLQSTGAELGLAGPKVQLQSRAGEVLDVLEDLTLSLEIGGGGPRVTPATFAVQGAACVGGRDWVLLDLEGIIGVPESLPEILVPRASQPQVLSPAEAVVDQGWIEQQGGRLEFYIQDVPWADLHFEGPRSTRVQRMLQEGREARYPIHGLRPGEAFRYRFLVGDDQGGQIMGEWTEAQYSGLGGLPSNTRVTELSGGRLQFLIESVPWAQVHRRSPSGVQGFPMSPNSNGQLQWILEGLEVGESVEYRWVVGVDQLSGQYDTDWTLHVYAGLGGGDDLDPTPVPPSPPIPPDTEEPVDPTDPDDATDPTDPADPIDPEDPSDPSEPPPANAGDTDRPGWQLVWSDEFDRESGTSPDASRWGFDLGGGGFGNAEHQYYTDRPENVSHDGAGHLVITARKETLPGSTCWYGACQYSSARLLTAGKFSQQYGRIEARMQLPVGQGVWPAFWMLGADIGEVGWPYSGEIDIMENVGHVPGRVHGTLHGPGYSGAGGVGGHYELPSGQRFTDGFHTFAIEWSPESIRWEVDGELYHVKTPADLPNGAPWVYDHPFFLLLNVAIGGYWPGYPDASTVFPQVLKVDYVRVYEEEEAEEPEPSVFTASRNAFYLISQSDGLNPGALALDPGADGQFDRVPGDRGMLAYEARGLSADYDPNLGQTAFDLSTFGGETGIAYLEARVLYDFEGDGGWDRVENFTGAPTHAVRELSRYESDVYPLISGTGSFENLRNGTVRLELQSLHTSVGVDLWTSAAPEEGRRSRVEVPFQFEASEIVRIEPPKTPVVFPEAILCASGDSDPRCGPAFVPEQAMAPETLEQTLSAGLQAFRFEGEHGACASCHVPDGFDLAFIGYSDADIRRRALEHVDEVRAAEIVGLIHAQRQKHDLRRVVHPERFRPLQPGFEPLPGATVQDRDLAFLEFLRDEVGLLLVTDSIDSLEKAREAQSQLQSLDLRTLRIGVQLDRWSEDPFHGLSHVGQDPLNPSEEAGHQGSVAEWLPNMGIRPTDPEAFHAAFDAYAASPTDAAFWTFYDGIRESAASHEPLSSEADRRAFEWMLTKYESIQVLGHMWRQGTLEYPDRTVDQVEGNPVADRSVAIERNPIWRVGDLIRQRPLNCDHPDGCTVFPTFVSAEMDLNKQRLQSQILQRAWFWAGWMIDPALLTSDESFETVSGDYFYPLHQGHWGGHYAFILARMSVEKAQAEGWEKRLGRGTTGHGQWASIRPFLVYKHSEFQRPLFGAGDPRREMQRRLLDNTARMWLYLVNDDLAQSGAAFDRAGTAWAMNFARLNWLDGTDPGGDRTETDRLFSEIVDRLREAEERRQPHHTDDLYDYLPVPRVSVD
ncbi:MAG: hypothetical protein CBC48_15025 [bacterium TMED88]|nr:hypothetical protein [Deltaproteobacteria bacterium]OUV26661.1 MAG: hypothetical protein CBC48_15025 [bacterium TMED88]